MKYEKMFKSVEVSHYYNHKTCDIQRDQKNPMTIDCKSKLIWRLSIILSNLSSHGTNIKNNNSYHCYRSLELIFYLFY